MASHSASNGDHFLPAGGRRKGGIIPEDIQAQARKVDSPMVNELLVSARKGYTDAVLRLLREGGAQRAVVCDKQGRNSLHLACHNGHLDTALAIIQTSLLDINAANKRGFTALHDACNEGHVHVVHLLLAMSADIQARTKEGWTCLMGACSNGNIAIAKILIGAGSEINATAKLGYTPLHVAAWKGQTAMVEMLVREGCNVLAQSYDCKTPLQLAQEEEKHECVTILQAVTTRQSEHPEYRIAYLEGQLRLLNDKLVSAHVCYDQSLAGERATRNEAVAQATRQHEAELELMRQRIASLEIELAESKKSVEVIKHPNIKSECAMPESAAGKIGHKNKITKKKSSRKEEGADLDDRCIFSPTSTDITNVRLRSASLTNLTEVEMESDAVRQSTPRSDKLSITDMVAESLRNPITMAAIRNELKADALTPRIQRKFAPKAPSTLPSIANGGQISPRARGTARTTCKGPDPVL